MKVRSGFVANSSSSSFIILCEEIPETTEELKDKVFGDVHTVPYEYGDERFSPYDLATMIKNDLNEAKEEIIDEKFFHGGYDYEANDYRGVSYWSYHCYDKANAAIDRKYGNIYRIDDNDERQRIMMIRMRYERALTNKVIREDYKHLYGKKAKVIEYGDDTRIGSTLEHQGYLENGLNAIRVSNH